MEQFAPRRKREYFPNPVLHCALMPKTVSDRLILFLATGFYSGYSPVAPGTAGSAVGVAAYFLLRPLGWPAYIAVTLAVTLMGIWISGRAEALFGQKDCKHIVIDEIAGQLIALFMAPATWWGILSGFALFRLFDITKFWPISACEKLKGGAGVMLDDAAAGLLALLALQLIYLGI